MYPPLIVSFTVVAFVGEGDAYVLLLFWGFLVDFVIFVWFYYNESSMKEMHATARVSPSSIVFPGLPLK